MILEKANTALRSNMSPDSAMLLKVRTEPRIEAVLPQEKAIRRLSQWVFDPVSNTLTARQNITGVSAKGLIVNWGKLKP
jgi:hypothetical protein